MSEEQTAREFASRFGGTAYRNPNGTWTVRISNGSMFAPSLIPREEWNAAVAKHTTPKYTPHRGLQAALNTPFLGPAIGGLYAIGAGLNAASGGTTTTYSAREAVTRGVDNIKKDAQGQPVPQTVSNTVAAASFLNPADLSFQLPGVNRYTPLAVKDAVQGVGGFAWDLIPPWVKWTAAGVGVALLLPPILNAVGRPTR